MDSRLRAIQRFLPGPLVCIAYVVVLLIMVRLGMWQLDRAAQKIALQQAAELAQVATPQPFEQVSQNPVQAAARLTRVALIGHFDERVTFLWDNRTHDGRVGFEVIGLFRLAGSKDVGRQADVRADAVRDTDSGPARAIWVNRGWVPAGPSRARLPNVRLPARERSATLQITGLATRPSRGFAQGQAIISGEQWPRVLHYVDFKQMQAVVGEPVTALLVQPQVGDNPTAAISGGVDAPALWFVDAWQPAASGPEVHWGYAFQWFAMAITLTGLFILINWRRYRQIDALKRQ